MPHRDALSAVHLDVRAGGAPSAPARPADDTPFCIALLADAGGGVGGRDGAPLERRRPLLVDRDDLDAALARVAPTLSLDLGLGAPVVLPVRALDDLRPERLAELVPPIAALRDLRRRLADPRTFADAAGTLDAGAAPAPAATPTASPTAAATAGRLAGGSLLDAIVDAADDGPSAPAPAAADGDDLAAFLRRAVEPQLVPRPDARQQELLATTDAAVAALLRAVLRHPQVRALEAAWRGLDLLVRRVDTGPSLRLALFDLTRADLAEALEDADAAGDAPDAGPLGRLLDAGARALPGSPPWSLVVCLHDAGADVPLLDQLARLGAALGAPVLASAGGALVDAAAGGDARWAALRRAPHARALGLAAPALLLRLPYGADGDPCDDFPFEELEPGLDAEAAAARLCWGSAALAPTLALAAAFAADGWAMRPADHRDVARLPLHLHRTPSGTIAIPPTGRPLGERDALRLLDAGVMPLVAERDGDTARVLRVQAVAEPAAPLAGRWAGAEAAR